MKQYEDNYYNRRRHSIRSTVALYIAIAALALTLLNIAILYKIL